MKFLALYTPDPKTAGVVPTYEHLDEMGKFVEEQLKSGVLLMHGVLLPISKGGARVRKAGGKITVIDGPFTEAKEVIAGFAVLEASSREEAIEAGKRFHKVAGDGESELYQIVNHPERESAQP